MQWMYVYNVYIHVCGMYRHMYDDVYIQEDSLVIKLVEEHGDRKWVYIAPYVETRYAVCVCVSVSVHVYFACVCV